MEIYRSLVSPRAGDPPVLNENKFTLKDVLKDIHEGLVYKYNFGDSWEHIVTLEKILPADASTPAAALYLAGSRACPPEDCGGIGGYTELLKALKNKNHPEHTRMKEWLSRPFDPEFFDVAMTNIWLRKLKWAPRDGESASQDNQGQRQGSFYENRYCLGLRGNSTINAIIRVNDLAC